MDNCMNIQCKYCLETELTMDADYICLKESKKIADNPIDFLDNGIPDWCPGSKYEENKFEKDFLMKVDGKK